MSIVYSVVALAGLGLFFGVLITFASKKFEVQTDDRVEKLLEILPNGNCGGCGFAGCQAYAKAIVDGSAEPNLCSVCNAEAVTKIGEILDVKIKEKEACKAHVLCCGSSENTTEKYLYDGVKNCISASKVSGGYKSCAYACLGFGNCVDVCKFDAIHIVNGIAKTDFEKCVGCGACAEACPKNLIQLIPKTAKYFVKCSSRDRGADTKNNCKGGCIACGICVKNCPSDAINIENNVAVINYKKCTSCGICAEKCPKHIIAGVIGRKIK